MFQIYDDLSLVSALADMPDAVTHDLIERIVARARVSGLWDTLTCIVLIDDDDTAGDFEAVLGYPPSTGPLGGEGAAAVPYWSWREDHGVNGDTVKLSVPSGWRGCSSPTLSAAPT